MIGTPIFIVNGENLEDVDRIMKIAVKNKLKFKKDVIVELVNYRKHVTRNNKKLFILFLGS